MKQTQTFKPAKMNIFLLLAAICAVGILVFTVMLRAQHRNAVYISSADYTMETPSGFKYKCDIMQSHGAFSLRGYAFIDGERFIDVNTHVVLYHAKSGKYLQIPTDLELNQDALNVVADKINYSFGGFTSFVIEKQLKAPPCEYEIYIAFRSNGYNLLIPTGQSLEANT
ncbi:MAG: hypothetical protein RR087_09005 [Oscillospiraceae bacterium]